MHQFVGKHNYTLMCFQRTSTRFRLWCSYNNNTILIDLQILIKHCKHHKTSQHGKSSGNQNFIETKKWFHSFHTQMQLCCVILLTFKVACKNTDVYEWWLSDSQTSVSSCSVCSAFPSMYLLQNHDRKLNLNWTEYGKYKPWQPIIVFSWSW